MANLAMESFQGVSNPSDLPFFSYFNDCSFIEGGRDGLKIANLASESKSGYAYELMTESKGFYWGYRFYLEFVNSYSSYPFSFYVHLKNTDESSSILKFTVIKGGIVTPDNVIHKVIQKDAFFEMGVDETYWELRINAETIARHEHNLGDPYKHSLYFKALAGSSARTNLALLDFYINDKSGTQNNFFLGDVKINVYPVNADGSLNTGFSSSTGGDLYLAVDDIPVDTSEWVESVNIGSQVTFQLEDIPEDESPLAVKVSASATKMAATDSGIKLLSKIGDDIYKSDKLTLPVEGPQPTSIIYSQSPAGTAWNSSDLNSLEIGMEIVP